MVESQSEELKDQGGLECGSWILCGPEGTGRHLRQAGGFCVQLPASAFLYQPVPSLISH